MVELVTNEKAELIFNSLPTYTEEDLTSLINTFKGVPNIIPNNFDDYFKVGDSDTISINPGNIHPYCTKAEDYWNILNTQINPNSDILQTTLPIKGIWEVEENGKFRIKLIDDNETVVQFKKDGEHTGRKKFKVEIERDDPFAYTSETSIEDRYFLMSYPIIGKTKGNQLIFLKNLYSPEITQKLLIHSGNFFQTLRVRELRIAA